MAPPPVSLRRPAEELGNVKGVVTAASVGMAAEDGSRGSASGLWHTWAEGRDLSAESSPEL